MNPLLFKACVNELVDRFSFKGYTREYLEKLLLKYDGDIDLTISSIEESISSDGSPGEGIQANGSPGEDIQANGSPGEGIQANGSPGEDISSMPKTNYTIGSGILSVFEQTTRSKDLIDNLFKFISNNYKIDTTSTLRIMNIIINKERDIFITKPKNPGQVPQGLKRTLSDIFVDSFNYTSITEDLLTEINPNDIFHYIQDIITNSQIKKDILFNGTDHVMITLDVYVNRSFKISGLHHDSTSYYKSKYVFLSYQNEQPIPGPEIVLCSDISWQNSNCQYFRPQIPSNGTVFFDDEKLYHATPNRTNIQPIPKYNLGDGRNWKLRYEDHIDSIKYMSMFDRIYNFNDLFMNKLSQNPEEQESYNRIAGKIFRKIGESNMFEILAHLIIYKRQSVSILNEVKNYLEKIYGNIDFTQIYNTINQKIANIPKSVNQSDSEKMNFVPKFSNVSRMSDSDFDEFSKEKRNFIRGWFVPILNEDAAAFLETQEISRRFENKIEFFDSTADNSSNIPRTEELGLDNETIKKSIEFLG